MGARVGSPESPVSYRRTMGARLERGPGKETDHSWQNSEVGRISQGSSGSYDPARGRSQEQELQNTQPGSNYSTIIF
jgi:hypothetical protein